MRKPAFRLPSSARSLAVKAYLRHLAATGKSIILGPWRSELGFEVLYWLPFLAWAQKYAGINPDRCIAISRGGMGAFYPAKAHVDLYTLRSLDEVRLENQFNVQALKMIKQMRMTDWDTAVCRDAAKQQGLDSYHVLHPSWMYWLFEAYWEERATVRLIADHARFDSLPVANLPEDIAKQLPKDFIAVRFYERATFPLSEPVRNMVTSFVRQLAHAHPVVLLNQGLFADDHTDLPIAGENILTINGVKPEENFILQAALLARCEAFVGTYGGISQWALRYKKPVLSFVTGWQGTAHAHRNLSHILSANYGVPFEVSDLRMIKLWGEALGAKALEPVAA